MKKELTLSMKVTNPNDPLIHQSITPAFQNQSYRIMLDNTIFDRISDLRAEGEPFVVATVVSCENPTSAKPGAKAIVLQDGSVRGWIGGSCAQPIVSQEAKKALRDGLPRLLKIGANEAAEFGRSNGALNFEMTCYSGGAMEIFIEPVLPKAQLLLVGNSPDLQALARLAEVMNFQVFVFDPEITEGCFPQGSKIYSEMDFNHIRNANHAFVVVATHGRYDEEAVREALASEATYIGLIASKKRASAIFDYLKSQGVTEEQLNRVKVPAGLDIGARSPDEIALSILAEIVEYRRRKSTPEPEAHEQEGKPSSEEAIDPVCAMTVNIQIAKFKTEIGGKLFYFCCVGCQQKFEKGPEKYMKENTTALLD